MVQITIIPPRKKGLKRIVKVLQLQTKSSVPQETALVTSAAFPKGNLYMTMRDEIGTISIVFFFEGDVGYVTFVR